MKAAKRVGITLVLTLTICKMMKNCKVIVESPVNVRHGSKEYWQRKCES